MCLITHLETQFYSKIGGAKKQMHMGGDHSWSSNQLVFVLLPTDHLFRNGIFRGTAWENEGDDTPRFESLGPLIGAAGVSGAKLRFQAAKAFVV